MPLHEYDDAERDVRDFDAAKAQCFIKEEREHILAVIESAFGGFSKFNRSVSGLFLKEKTTGGTATRKLSIDQTLVAAPSLKATAMTLSAIELSA